MCHTNSTIICLMSISLLLISFLVSCCIGGLSFLFSFRIADTLHGITVLFLSIQLSIL